MLSRFIRLLVMVVCFCVYAYILILDSYNPSPEIIENPSGSPGIYQTFHGYNDSVRDVDWGLVDRQVCDMLEKLQITPYVTPVVIVKPERQKWQDGLLGFTLPHSAVIKARFNKEKFVETIIVHELYHFYTWQDDTCIRDFLRYNYSLEVPLRELKYTNGRYLKAIYRANEYGARFFEWYYYGNFAGFEKWLPTRVIPIRTYGIISHIANTRDKPKNTLFVLKDKEGNYIKR